MNTQTIPPSTDGFYHPGNEQEVAMLVRYASAAGLQIRARGSTHSLARVIYTDPLTDDQNHVQRQTLPPGPHLNLMLDKLCNWRVRDEGRRIVEAEAGIHLGADPFFPNGSVPELSSLLYQLWARHRWTVADLGGITHQTVSGFTATGSSGGSLKFTVNTNLYGLRFVDGLGNLREVTRDDADPSLYYAAVPAMGLLGIVTAVIFQCDPAFNIAGSERITTYRECEVDLFGEDPTRPTLARWLKDTEYGRVEWWPQRGCERIEVWKVARIGDDPDFKPQPYRQFGKRPVLVQIGVSIFYNVACNLEKLSVARVNLRRGFRHVGRLLGQAWGNSAPARAAARMVAGAGSLIVTLLMFLLAPFARMIARAMPRIFVRVLNTFIPLTKGKPTRFQDYSWRGLPVDAEVDDILVPAGFTEIWIPIARSTEVMCLMRTFFEEPKDAHEALERTGILTWELYGAPATSFWLSPSYSTGTDEWQDGVLRVDPYWFEGQTRNPAATFFPALWRLLRMRGIPFRLHWGKYQPLIPSNDPERWVEYFKQQYPRWNDFLRVRAELDPNNVFLTSYWRERFGLWSAPQPRKHEPMVAASASAF